jgi:hypothetical protein
MAQLFSRRRFTRIIGGAGATGTALLTAMCVEVEEEGELSEETVKAFLAFTDQEAEGEEQIVEIQEALASFLETLRTIREHEVPQAVEPATMFRARP